MRKSRLLTTGLAYLLLGVFLGLERRLRQGSSAQSLETGAFDRKSTRVVRGAFLFSMLAVLLAPLLTYFHRERTTIPNVGGRIGLGVMLGGISLRAWANTTLGAFYTRTLRMMTDQQLIEQGSYRVLRHSGYSGSILLWIGAGLATTNWVVTLIIALVSSSAYEYRIRVEEAMLAQTFGAAYQAYRQRTWKLFPHIY